MKNILKALGLAALLGIAGTRCQKDSTTKEYTISRTNFNEEVGRIQDWYQYNTINHRPVQFAVHSESTWRDYPGDRKPLPRGEVKEYRSGK